MSALSEQERKISQRLFVIDPYPVRYLFIPKCGCTYVKNVLYTLQNGVGHAKPLRVHDDDDQFSRASDFDLAPTEIAAEDYAFTVVRKPLDRFLSLYFDKVVGKGRAQYVPLAATLAEKRGLIEAPVGIPEHQRNLMILIDWLGENLEHGTDLPKEAHWTPQMYRQNIMKTCNLKLLLIEELTPQLRVLLTDIVPDIDTILGSAERNKSAKGLNKSELLTDAIRNRVAEVYGRDRKLYQRTRRAWKALEHPTAADIPRFQVVMAD